MHFNGPPYPFTQLIQEQIESIRSSIREAKQRVERDLVEAARQFEGKDGRNVSSKLTGSRPKSDSYPRNWTTKSPC